jgi:hypothetical protein
MLSNKFKARSSNCFLPGLKMGTAMIDPVLFAILYFEKNFSTKGGIARINFNIHAHHASMNLLAWGWCLHKANHMLRGWVLTTNIACFKAH